MHSYEIRRVSIRPKPEYRVYRAILRYQPNPPDQYRLQLSDIEDGLVIVPLVVSEEQGVILFTDPHRNIALHEADDMFTLFVDGEFSTNFPKNQEWEVCI